MDRAGHRFWIAALAIAIPGLMFWATLGTGDSPDFEIPNHQYLTQTAAGTSSADGQVVTADAVASADEGEVAQVVGKQLGSYRLPGSSRSRSSSSTRSGTASSKSSGGGFFRGLFGGSSDETKSVPTPPGELQGGSEEINWEGVPFHEVGQSPRRAAAAPIRSSRSQSRVANRLKSSGGATASVAKTPGRTSPAPRVYRNSTASKLSVPRPPAESAVQAPVAVQKSRSRFSADSSSRRGDRAVVTNASPTASQEVRPDYSDVPDLVPRVSRRELAAKPKSKPEPQPVAKAPTPAPKAAAPAPEAATLAPKAASAANPNDGAPQVASKTATKPAEPAPAISTEAVSPIAQSQPAPAAKPAPSDAAPSPVEKKPISSPVKIAATPVAPSAQLSAPTPIAVSQPKVGQMAQGGSSAHTAPHTPASLSGSAAIAIPPATTQPYPHLGYVGGGSAETPPALSEPARNTTPNGDLPPLPFANDAFAARQPAPATPYHTASTPIGSGVPQRHPSELATQGIYGSPSGYESRNDSYGHPQGDQPSPRPFAAESVNIPAGNRHENQMRAVNAAPGNSSVTSELPGIRVVTLGPDSMMIRQTKEYEIRVENRGAIDAEGVVVRAMIPNWAELRGEKTTQGDIEKQGDEKGEKLVWTIKHLAAGQAEKLFVKLTAARSGDYNLDVDWTLMPRKAVAHVTVHEPQLDLTIEGPDEVVYGQSQTYKVRVLNPGDGIAPNVVFILSPGSTPQTQRIGDIPPGKEAQFDVELTAQDLADLKIHGLATGDLDLRTEATKVIRVSAADLQAELTGPETKYQDTEAMYGLELQNVGTATSERIIASLRLPSGAEYLGGIEGAVQRGNLVKWEINKLSPKDKLNYEFRCNMNATGEQRFAFDAKGTAAGQTDVAISTAVESIADLVLSVNDPVAPAPVGSKVTYEITIRNRGSRAARDVNVIAQFSHGIEPLQIIGQSGEVVTGQVLFDAIPQINAGGQIVLKVVAEADRAGHHRFRTEVTSGDVVLVAEEATHYMSPRSDRVSRRSGDKSPQALVR